MTLFSTFCSDDVIEENDVIHGREKKSRGEGGKEKNKQTGEVRKGGNGGKGTGNEPRSKGKREKQREKQEKQHKRKKI